MSNAVKAALLATLKNIREHGPVAAHYGICAAIADKWVGTDYWQDEIELYSLTTALFEGWPKFSGSTGYPVPAPESYELGDHLDVDAADFNMVRARAMYVFEDNDDLWVGEYGALRRELLDFMIAELEARV